MIRPEPAATLESSPPRVLLVARRFPPHSDPTSYRWLRFVIGLARRGWNLEILTVRAEPSLEYYDEGLLELVPPGVIVHRVNPGPIEKNVLRARRRKAAGPAATAAANSRPARRGVGWALREVVKHAYEGMVPLIPPDPTVEWIPWAVSCGARVLRQRRFDLIVSSSSPFSSHVVARFLKRRSGVPWIGDFSDPLADNVFIRRPRWRLLFDRRIERGWITAMDGVIVPVEEMAELFRAHYPPLPPGKIHLVPYGYAEEMYETVEPAKLEGFTIIHTGAFYPGMRDPMPFFNALIRLRDLPLRFHHAGGMIPSYHAFLEERGISALLEHHGFLPRSEVVPLQMGASCLLVIGNKGGLQLPGKLLDYLGAKRPILMLKNDVHDIAADLVTSTGTGLVVMNEPDSIEAGIRRLHGWWKDGTLDAHFNLGAGGEYSWAHQEQRLAEALSGHLMPRR